MLIILIYIGYKNPWILEKTRAVFRPEYYIAKPVNIRVYSEINTEKMLLPAEQAYIDAPAKYEPVQSDHPLTDLNNGNIDIAIVRRTGHVGYHKNIGFVGNMLDSTLMLLSPNSVAVHDFMDLAHVENPVIHVNNYEAGQMMRDIAMMYPEIKVTITNNSNNPTIYAFLMVHPAPAIANLVKERPMHAVTIARINNGDYTVKLNERQFFSRHRHYEKANFDMRLIAVKHYPGLSIRGQLLYYPTIKYKYTMFANTQFSPAAIKRILTFLIEQKKLPLTDIAYEPEKEVQTHPGARQVYLERKIYTYTPLPEIWQGF